MTALSDPALPDRPLGEAMRRGAGEVLAVALEVTTEPLAGSGATAVTVHDVVAGVTATVEKATQ